MRIKMPIAKLKPGEKYIGYKPKTRKRKTVKKTTKKK